MSKENINNSQESSSEESPWDSLIGYGAPYSEEVPDSHVGMTREKVDEQSRDIVGPDNTPGPYYMDGSTLISKEDHIAPLPPELPPSEKTDHEQEQ